MISRHIISSLRELYTIGFPQKIRIYIQAESLIENEIDLQLNAPKVNTGRLSGGTSQSNLR